MSGRSSLRLNVARARLLLAAALIVALIIPFFNPTPAKADVLAGDVAFEDTSGGNSRIAIRAASNGAVTDLTPSDLYAVTPDVSPDGSRIIFVSPADDGSGSYTVHAMNSDGSGRIELVPRDTSSGIIGAYATHDSYPRWSADGQWIVFNRVVQKGDGNHYDIDTIHADGTDHTTALTDNFTEPSDVEDLFPAWSPDGSKIAFVSNRDGEGTSTWPVYVMNADGGSPHRASSDDYVVGTDSLHVFAEFPNWSPDGGRIYFVNAITNSPVDYYSSSDWSSSGATGNVRQAAAQAASLRLSANGSTLVYYTFASADCTGVCTLATSGSGAAAQLDSSSSEHNPTYVDNAWPTASAKHLVALGDSVAAGEGINYGYMWNGSGWTKTGPDTPTWTDPTAAYGNTDSDLQQNCHQSDQAYDRLFYADNYKVLNMACTGASAKYPSVDQPTGGVLVKEKFYDPSTNDLIDTAPRPQLGSSSVRGIHLTGLE